MSPRVRIFLVFLGVGFALCTVSAIWLAVTLYKESRKWSGYVYASGNKGHNPRYFGVYESREGCIEGAKSQLARGESTAGPFPVDSFLCGQGCRIDASFGSLFVTEIACDDRHVVDPSL